MNDKEQVGFVCAFLVFVFTILVIYADCNSNRNNRSRW